MSDDQRKREAVRAMYPSRRWAQRVDRMSDAQVIAIYLKTQTTVKKEQPTCDSSQTESAERLQGKLF